MDSERIKKKNILFKRKELKYIVKIPNHSMNQLKLIIGFK